MPDSPEKVFIAVLRHAQAGKAWACYSVGMKYETGLGVAPNIEEARRWFERAVTHQEPASNGEASCALGNLDRRVSRYSDALRNFEEAAGKGHATAMFNLGSMYRDGEGVPRSPQAAATWYLRGAELGSPLAQGEAGRCRILGLQLFRVSGRGLPVPW